MFVRLKDAFWSASAEVFGDPGVLVLSAAGLAVMLLWLTRCEGVYALEQVPVRRSRMHGFVPLILLLVWLGLMGLALHLNKWLDARFNAFGAEMLSYVLTAGIELVLIVAMFAAAHVLFVRGIRGMGLRLRTAGSDAKWSLVYLLAIYPLIFIGLWAVLFAGRLAQGSHFTLARHESIEVLVTADSILLRLFVAVFAILIVPVFEETLFRGYLQTAVSMRTGNAWLAIGITSVLFAILHPWQHQVGLFFLSCAMGYAYERSGSLLRPIFMHAIFNGLSVILNLLQP